MIWVDPDDDGTYTADYDPAEDPFVGRGSGSSEDFYRRRAYLVEDYSTNRESCLSDLAKVERWLRAVGEGVISVPFDEMDRTKAVPIATWLAGNLKEAIS